MNKPVNFLLVVLYKTTPENSPTIISIVEYIKTLAADRISRYRLLIRDNSPLSSYSSCENLSYLVPGLAIDYEHSPANISLSKIYNDAASWLPSNSYLTLLDQDSIVGSDYFDELQLSQIHGFPLIIPRVRCQGLLVSPGSRFFAHGMLLKDITGGPIRSKNSLAINSGMSILSEVFLHIKYDERLRFYGTDTYFMKQFEKFYPRIQVLNATMDHSLAENDSESSAERKAAIAKERRDSWKIIFSETFLERLFLSIYEKLISIRHSLKKSSV